MNKTKVELTETGIFVQVLNPMTGRMEWKSQPEDYDYQQELARAAFADMLHDSERNKMYYEGLKAAIALKRSQGQPVHVLDIGKYNDPCNSCIIAPLLAALK